MSNKIINSKFEGIRINVDEDIYDNCYFKDCAIYFKDEDFVKHFINCIIEYCYLEGIKENPCLNQTQPL